MNQCWPRSPTSYGVTRPQWVNYMITVRITWNHTSCFTRFNVRIDRIHRIFYTVHITRNHSQQRYIAIIIFIFEWRYLPWLCVAGIISWVCCLKRIHDATMRIQPWSFPIITWYQNNTYHYQYAAYQKQIKIWIENLSPRDHVTTKLCGICLAMTKFDTDVCLKNDFMLHTVLFNGNCKLLTTVIYPEYNISVYFSMGLPNWWK